MDRGSKARQAGDRRGHGQAFLWENGVLTNLNDVSASDSNWDLKGAAGINELGQIVGLGHVGGRKGEEHGYLLTPNP